MSGAQYRLDPAAFRKLVLQADFMVAEMGRRADKVLAEAEATAPTHSGRYRTSFRSRTVKRGGIHNDRAAGVVSNSDPAALSIEFGHFTRPAHGVGRGSTFVPGHYTLTRALHAAGD